jgi:hypothetical protein
LIDIKSIVQSKESRKPTVLRKPNRPEKELIQESEKPKLKVQYQSTSFEKPFNPRSLESPFKSEP